jgi:hypothetical protein
MGHESQQATALAGEQGNAPSKTIREHRRNRILFRAETENMWKKLQTFRRVLWVIPILGLSPLWAQSPSVELQTFLQSKLQFSKQEIGDVQKGKVVAKVLPSEGHEVAVFGITPIKAPADFFVDSFRDIERFKKGTFVLQVKKFSTPPRLEDLDQLTIDDSDWNALKKCKVGDCDVKLPQDMILRLRREMDWSAPNAREKATELFRAAALEYVDAYLQGGNQELTEYNDKKQPVRLAEEFDAIMEASPYIFEYDPKFHDYLHDYPKKKLEAVEDFVYWSKEKFGLKPVISITHVSIYKVPGSHVTLMASKQIYASHYFESSLGLTVTVEVEESPNPTFYLLYFNRSRSDGLRGGFSGLTRGIVKGRARSGAQDNLEKIRRTIEERYSTSMSK